MRSFSKAIACTVAIMALSACSPSDDVKAKPLPEGVLSAPSLTAESFSPLVTSANQILLNYNNVEPPAEAVENWNNLSLRSFNAEGEYVKDGRFTLYYTLSSPGGFCLTDTYEKTSLGVDYTNVTSTKVDFRMYPYANTHCAFQEEDRNTRPYIFLTKNSILLSDEAKEGKDAKTYESILDIIKGSELVGGLRNVRINQN